MKKPTSKKGVEEHALPEGAETPKAATRGAEAPAEAEASASEEAGDGLEGPEAPVKKLYPGKQQDLYLYARLGWRNYLDFLAIFSNFSPFYTAELATEQLAFIEMTKALPDQAARVVMPLDMKDDLDKLNKSVLAKFADGKLYVQRTYTDPKKQKTMLDAAGEGYYVKAQKQSWTSTSSLISAFKRFLTTYGQQLIDSKQMPPNFPKEFDTVSEPFVQLWESYKTTWDGAHTERSEKAENNNLIYKVLSEMCEVGKKKLADKPEQKKKFVILELLNEVSGHSPAGLKGFCLIGGDKKKPVAKAKVSDVNLPARSALTDNKGRYDLTLPTGEQELLVEAEGFVPQRVKKTIKSGIKSRLNFSMVPLPTGPSGGEGAAPDA